MDIDVENMSGSIVEKDEFVQYIDSLEKGLAYIKLQAIGTIEKKNKRISELEKEIKSMRESFEKNIIQELEGIKSSIENKNKKAMEHVEEALRGKEADNKRLQDQLDEKKEECDQYKRIAELTKKEHDQEINSHRQTKKEKEQIEKEKEQIEKELEKLKEEICYELYEEYCKLAKDFRDKFSYIDSANIFSFFKTSGGDRVLMELHTFIANAVQDGKAEAQNLIHFFNSLFIAHKKQDKLLMRLEVKDGDRYDNREMIKIGNGASQGKVVKVLFQGFKKGNVTKESLVEVEQNY